MARSRRVFYIEEPVPTNSYKLHFELIRPASGVTVCRPHIPGGLAGFAEENIAPLRHLLRDLIDAESIESWIAWFYSPQALPLLGHRTPVGIVYDCMDQCSAFRGAPRPLERREEELLDVADLVLVGGQSLEEERKNRHADIHCFPSSVDQDHFRAHTNRRDPPLQASIPHPRLGFFGVLDERLDLELLAAVADARPHWHFVMVGPVVRIDAATLPLRENIYYIGRQPYASLPNYVAGWDVCLLPFARNDAARFVGPTKVLEYIAAERPIVSTSIHDVVSEFGDVVGIADSPERFTRLCEEALIRSEDERHIEKERMQRILSRTSWDQTVEAIEELVAKIEAVRWQDDGRGRRRRPSRPGPASLNWILTTQTIRH
jgi:glycosyltransferase involved in cell wall biosynthesis